MDILFDAQLESSVEPPVFSLMFDPEAMSLHCIGDMTTIMVQAHVFYSPTCCHFLFELGAM